MDRVTLDAETGGESRPPRPFASEAELRQFAERLDDRATMRLPYSTLSISTPAD